MRALAIENQMKSSPKGRTPGSASVFSLAPSPAPLRLPFGSALQAKPACPCGGGCPRCRPHLALQTKLKIGEPGDVYEQEADRMADELMRAPEPALQPT